MPPLLSATTRIAEAADWLTNIGTGLNSTAAAIASSTHTVSASTPVPVIATTPSASTIPSVTPNIICAALRQRRPTKALSEIAAAMGAKNG